MIDINTPLLRLRMGSQQLRVMILYNFIFDNMPFYYYNQTVDAMKISDPRFHTINGNKDIIKGTFDG